MALRKEQVLALLALFTVAMCGRGYFEEPAFTSRFAPTKAAYEPPPVAPAPLVTASGVPFARADFFTEPSETQPLPPRALEFPPRAPLSVAAVPLEIGPDYGHMWLLRLDGTPLDGVTITQGGDAAAAAPAAPAAPEAGPPQDRAAQEEQAARTYDRLWYGGLARPQFGLIEPENHDLFALEESGNFDGVKLKMRIYSLQQGKQGELRTYGIDAASRIDKIVLAGTLRNEIQKRVRKAQGYDLDKRRDLIAWLLDKAREDTSVYDEAMKQAEAYRKLPNGEAEGVRLIRRVHRARGDLAGELALLESLPTTGFDASFRFEGLGITKARLCLWADAEADLQKAVALKATDARPHAALAEFLRLRGRSGEALQCAKRAEQTIGSVPDPVEKARVARVIVACHLAVGDVDAARTVLQQQSPKGEDHAYLLGCVEYAAGQTGPALAAFRQAAGSADGGAALLGQAACLLRDNKGQEAHDLFLRVIDQDPMLRHRAATGLALLFLRIGQYESANQWLDRAFEADPQDPYAHYLRGRTLRLTGQIAAAADSLEAALQQRDDFVHALAEMGAVQATAALEGLGQEQDKAVLAARRYIDRAVALVKKPAVELCELQGLAAYVTADAKAAEAAFTKARDLASDERARWYGKGALAVVAYSRGLVEDAMDALERMGRDLGKDDALAKWAAMTMAAIDDHSQKETLGDTFEREDKGAIWSSDADGSIAPVIRNGRLLFRGTLTRGDLAAQREGAVKRGKNFLAVGVTMQLGPAHASNDVIAGLGIELQSGRSGAADFQVRVGIREGKPYMRIEDGRAENGAGAPPPDLVIPGFDPTARQAIELRVVPLGDEQSRMLTLLVSWNGVVVHRRDLKGLSASTNTELKTLLFTSNGKGRMVDVAFDDYRLERRKER